MKKIIVSAAVAALTLTTTASALEDIKVNGQAKIWYETNDGVDLFNKASSVGEVAYKLGMTGKQGNVSVESEVSMGTTMGLEDVLVTNVRTATVQRDLYLSKMNVTAPLVADTVLKLGRQELNTPLAFTEKWNAQQNNFDAAVLVNSSVQNTTLIGAFVGQGNTADNATWQANQTFNQFHGGAYALAALYDNKSVAVNAWYYHVTDALQQNGAAGLGLAGFGETDGAGVVNAFWIDAATEVAGVNLKAIVAKLHQIILL